MKEKIGLGILGAAALAACSPEKAPEPAQTREAAAEQMHSTSFEGEAPKHEQYTKQEREEIASGLTPEHDSMNQEELDKLKQ